LVDVLGFRIDWVTVHQGFFVVWTAVTGLHLLGRIIPALRITAMSARDATVPGSGARWTVLATVLASAVVLAVVLVHADSGWASWRLSD
jgi:hypothetical protein